MTIGTAVMWLGLCVGGYLAFAFVWGTLHQRRLRRKEGGWERDRFVSEFTKRGVEQSISGAVYDFYQKDVGVESYKVSPGDTLESDYRKSHEDIDDDAERIARDCSLELPPEYVLKRWAGPLRTVEDMVLWVDWVRQHQQ